MRISWLLIALLAVAGNVWGDIGMDRPDPKTWAIVRPAEAHPAYAHAAGELARYLKGMTGVDVPVKTDAEPPAAAVRFVIGGPDVNAAAKGVTVAKDLGDGYVVKSIEDPAGVRVVMAGARGRSAVYAVYGYLRRLCDCGFFRDGDYVPRRETVPVRGIDVVEKPVFSFREVFVFLFHYGPQAKYSSIYEFEQWKLWMDFAAKTGANSYEIDYFPGGFFLGDAFYRAFPECDPSKEAGQLIPPKTQLEISRRVVKYVRELDMDLVYGVSYGGLNSSYAEAHPDRQYLRPGPGFHGQAVNLRVTDPAFEETMTKLWTAAIAELGPADWYFIQYAHEQQSAERYNAYDSAVRLFRKLDPKARFLFWTWDLDFGRQEVQSADERLKIFDERLPKDALIQDQYVSRARGLDAKEGENPFHRPWYHVNRLGEFHSGDRLAHGLGRRGDKNLLSESVAAEGKIGSGCVGVDIYNEMDFGNFLALQLSRDLAWNARRTQAAWKSGDWLARFALERYGAASAAVLAESVRASQEAEVLGSISLGLKVEKRGERVVADHLISDLAKAKAAAAARAKDDAAVEKAVRLALQARDTQKDNPLYVTYLYDLVTQSMMDQGYARFNLAWAEAVADPKSKSAAARLTEAVRYAALLKDLMASQDRDKLSRTLDRLGALRAEAKVSTPTDEHIAKMLATWHYDVISYEKWAAQFHKPLVAGLMTIETALAKGAAPTRADLDAAIDAGAPPWWACCGPKDLRETGGYVPAKSTVELVQDALDGGFLRIASE